MKKIILLVLTVMLLAGCSKKEEVRVLQKPVEESVQSVRDFNEVKQTEAQTQRETETERITEPQTETETVETELETETETESESEVPADVDYDFSDMTILQAVFEPYGGLTNARYKKTVVQDMFELERIETIEADDGSVTIELLADVTSGKTNKSVYITTQSEDLMRQILLGFENGITEKNIDTFMAGDLSSSYAAKRIGLAEASVIRDEQGIHAKLIKTAQEDGAVPCWEEGTATLETLLQGVFSSTEFTEETTYFMELLSQIDFGQLEMISSEASTPGVTYDESGNVVGYQVHYASSYNSTSGNKYQVTAEFSGTDEDGLEFICHMDGLKEDAFILRTAEFLYNRFFSDSFDYSTSLSSAGVYTCGKAAVSLIDDGFILKISN